MDNVIAYLIFICFLLLIVYGIVCKIYTLKDHWYMKSEETLNANAKIIDVDVKRFNKYKFKTRVEFDDGFEYISFDTDAERVGINTTRISVDSFMIKIIINRAMLKHKELVDNVIQSETIECDNYLKDNESH